MTSIYDSISRDPFLQQAKEELEAINIEIASITRLSVQTIEDKVRKDALLEKQHLIEETLRFGGVTEPVNVRSGDELAFTFRP